MVVLRDIRHSHSAQVFTYITRTFKENCCIFVLTYNIFISDYLYEEKCLTPNKKERIAFPSLPIFDLIFIIGSND